MEEALRVSEPESLVGRKDELALAGAATRDLFAGRPSVLVIEGEAGIGKTRLVQHIVDDARARGASTFLGQAHPFERKRPFGLVSAALGLSRRSPDPRKASIAALLAGDDAATDPASAGGIQYRVVEEIVDLVQVSCAQTPTLLVAEDLHWADSASLLAILSVVRQLSLERLLVVATTRPSPLPADVVRFLDDVAAGLIRTLCLQPLSPDEVAILVREQMGHAPGPALTAMLDKAGGNPLWVVALLRALADGGMLRQEEDVLEPTTFELPSSLDGLVARRLRHLPPATLELLQIAAVLGDAVRFSHPRSPRLNSTSMPVRQFCSTSRRR
jgi:predicted ATPase